MGPLLVVLLEELIEAALLLQEVLGSWLGGFLLQRQMHSLAAAICSGRPGLMRSSPMPGRNHDTESLVKPNGE